MAVATQNPLNLPVPLTFATVAEERQHRKQRLAGASRRRHFAKYRHADGEWPARGVAPDEIDLVAFTSASQAINLFAVAQQGGKEASLRQSLGRTLVASIGPVCSATLRKLAVRVDLEAQPPKLGPFIDAIKAALTSPGRLDKS